MDSAACVALYLRQGFIVETLYIDYGQAAAKYEEQAAMAIAKYFNVPHTKYVWSGGTLKGSGEILGRNAFLLFGALTEVGGRHGMIAIGLHSGTPYYDCGQSFMSAIQPLFDGCTDGRIKAVAPLLSWTKREIWELCVDCSVPLELTYSCEKGSDTPCGECLSCQDRKDIICCLEPQKFTTSRPE